MKRIFLVTFILIFMSNIGLVSYASESDNNKYVLENQYKKDFLLTSDNFVSITKEKNEESINPNIWLWSILFPGLGQFIMGENGWGWGFFIPSFILTIFNIVATTLILMPKGNIVGDMSALLVFVVTIPLFIVYLILYFSSLINANQLNHSKLMSKEGSISETILSDNDSINENLWLSSFIIPGSGQMLYGEYLRGFLFMIFESLIVIGSAFLINITSSNPLFFIISLIISVVFFSIVHIWNIYDSYELKEKKVRELTEKFKSEINKKNKKDKEPENMFLKNNSLVYQFNF